MKRYDLWLGLVLGVTAGLFGWILFGNPVFSEGAGKSAVGSAQQNKIFASARPGRSKPPDPMAATKTSAQDWMKNARPEAIWPAPPAGQPTARGSSQTPSRTRCILESALFEPIPGWWCLFELMAQGRISLSRWRCCARRKTNINNSSMGMQGPAMVGRVSGIALGEIDPGHTALAAGPLGCQGPSNYVNRDHLEKQLFSGMAHH